jgi:hypothetical protein
MPQEVKQLYAERLQEKEKRIVALSQELTQAKKGFWACYSATELFVST